jgi:hypothetical protein
MLYNKTAVDAETISDFSAHSNYTELALRELGVEAFPHVGTQTEIDVRGKKVFPVVTGTFGMTDFLHSLCGELGDKIAQSEVEEMESKLDNASDDAEKNDQVSILKEILDHVPWDLLGDNKPDPSKADELKAAASAKAEETKQNPLDPNATLGGVNIEQAKQQAEQTLKDMYPILEFHDQILKGVNKLISKVPGLDDLLENMSGALQIFVFSLLAPYVKPIIAQARLELKSSSEGILKSSEKGQYAVFEDEHSSDPTHSMLSKDHFSNVLNPVAGQVACATVRFVVPQIVDSWSDSGKDVRQTIDNILQVFHHPALRDENREGQRAMFETVKNWWEGKDDSEKEHLKEILSLEGVKAGKNHEGEGAEGGGHSHGAPPKKQNNGGVPSAQEGASVLSDLAGGLAGMVMQEAGLSGAFGTGGNRRNDDNSYGGGQSYQQSSEGRTNRRNEETSDTYGNSGRTSYGESEPSYRRNDNEDSYGGSGRTSGRNNEDSYGQSEGNSRRNNEGGGYGSSGRNESGGNSYGESGRQQQSGYGRQEETQYDEPSSRRSDRPSRRHNNEEDSYGSSRRNENDNDSYGSSRRDDGDSYGGRGNMYGGRDENSGNY